MPAQAGCFFCLEPTWIARASFSSLPEYRTVDALLQRMFESEIAPDDDGPSLDEILSFSPSDMYLKNPNFESSA